MTEPKSADVVAPRSEWLPALRGAAAEVFSMMVGATLDVSDATVPPVVAHVTGVIGITGAINAIFTLRCSDAAATSVASKMLGLSTEESAAQKFDAIGEVCNMIAGHFKHTIGYGDKCMLTVPTVVIGANYRIHSLAGERLECSAMYEGEPVGLALDIRQ